MVAMTSNWIFYPVSIKSNTLSVGSGNAVRLSAKSDRWTRLLYTNVRVIVEKLINRTECESIREKGSFGYFNKRTNFPQPR